MGDGLLDLAIAEAGGHRLWNSLRGLKVDLSIGGPIWALKGWPPERTFDQPLSLDTAREHIAFSPFTRTDRRMVFDAATDSVTMEPLDGEPVETLAPARAGFPLGRQRWMDYVAEVNGSTLVGHYTSRHRRFGGLLVATRRCVFRRNPDDTVNLNLPSITLDIHDVALIHADGDPTPARDQA
ncbi:hypothetical protein [Streptomyces noursei]|uniref:hypothetical protein n=1 Tax=Streptomyces noursei TaxID=1971 RepID=UPI00380BBFE4